MQASRRPMWRFNDWYLGDEALRGKLKTEIDKYFQTNTHSVSSYRILWAASKATIREAAKAFIRQQERSKLQQISDLEAKILESELRIGMGETGLVER